MARDAPAAGDQQQSAVTSTDALGRRALDSRLGVLAETVLLQVVRTENAEAEKV